MLVQAMLSQEEIESVHKLVRAARAAHKHVSFDQLGKNIGIDQLWFYHLIVAVMKTTIEGWNLSLLWIMEHKFQGKVRWPWQRQC